MDLHLTVPWGRGRRVGNMSQGARRFSAIHSKKTNAQLTLSERAVDEASARAIMEHGEKKWYQLRGKYDRRKAGKSARAIERVNQAKKRKIDNLMGEGLSADEAKAAVDKMEAAAAKAAAAAAGKTVVLRVPDGPLRI